MTTSQNRNRGGSAKRQDLDEFCVEDVLAMYEFVSDAMVWIKDHELTYRWANRAFLLNFSFPDQSRIVGKTDHDFAPAYLADLYQADDSRVLRGATIVARVEPVGTYEGLPCWNQTWKRVTLIDSNSSLAFAVKRRFCSKGRSEVFKTYCPCFGILCIL